MTCKLLTGDCVQYLREECSGEIDLSFLDPPFNQNKDYSNHNDKMECSKYWNWMAEVCRLIFKRTSAGGAIYFMQREKNTQHVLETLESAGWTFQNLIIWRKKTSAVPGNKRFGKQYQIIAFATKGSVPRVFNKLRIDPPLLATEKLRRPHGIFLTDVWDDIRELTSGYFAGNEPYRCKNGERFHKQQAPIRLLTRIILSSTKVGDMVLDPFAGTGTTLVVAKQLFRNAMGVDVDPVNTNLIEQRITEIRSADDLSKFRNDYIHTENLEAIWPIENQIFSRAGQTRQVPLALEPKQQQFSLD